MTLDSTPDKIRVLIADPDILFCVRLRRTLEHHGCVATIAHDGADAVERCAPDRYDAVIAGVTLPSPNGLDILRKLQTQSPETLVFLLCDEQTVPLAESGVREGALAYFLTSDEDLEEIAEAVTGAIETTEESRKPDLTTDIETEAEPLPPTALAEPGEISLDSLLTRLMHELIDSTLTKSLVETMKLLADAGAQLLEAAQGVVLLAQPTGLKIVTPFEGPTAMLIEFLERANDGFAYRVASARKTLIDAVPAEEAGQPPIQFIGTPLIARDQVVGVLVAYPLAPDRSLNLARVMWAEMFAAQGALAVELDRIRQENVLLSPTDPVSGALKRTTFLEMADREFRRSWRYNHPIACILIDVDDMSVINLDNSHEFGNIVLRQVAAVCRSIVRSVDLVGRYEADAFVVLLLMTGREGAKTVAERLRVGISALKLAGTQGPVSVTATLGVSTYPRPDCASIFDLLNSAQEAQRRARRAGANRIAYS